MKSKIIFSSLLIFILTIYGCGSKPVPDKLSPSVKAVFNLLLEKPQFVMYFNFSNMRLTKFWKDNISDSLLEAENSFGNILNNFKKITGTSMSQGLDEVYYSNSWTGQNAIVLKGAFDRNVFNASLKNDTILMKKVYPDSITVYIRKDNNFQFFLKDNFTLCASNYTEQIERMMNTSDTSNSGMLLNAEIMSAIERINFKKNTWMVTTEKTFIRGVFLNFVESKFTKPDSTKIIIPDTSSTGNKSVDSLTKTDQFVANEMYKAVNSISLCGDMDNYFNMNVQIECIDLNSAETIAKMLNGMITLSKLNNATQGGKTPKVSESILNSILVKNYESSVQISIKITSDNINEFRRSTLLTKPNE
jgi:hypothetical protein